MIPPVHTGLPRDVSGTIMRIHEGGNSYDVMLDPTPEQAMQAQVGEMVFNIPINFLRPDSILATGKDVQAQNAQQLLKGRRFKVPTYQRRYAWKKRDWLGLWNDIPKANHSMGTISVYAEDKRLMVCDGQQRLTTLCLILSAIKDVASSHNLKKIEETIEDLLFCNLKKYRSWKQKSNVHTIKEGDYLEFFRLIPTYSDRRSFYLAILDTKNEVNPNNLSLVAKAKEFFLKSAKLYDAGGIQMLFMNLMMNLRYVYFESFASGQHQ